MSVAILLLIAATGMRPGGDLRDVAMGDPVADSGTAPTVTIGAMPFTRTVTCTGSYTLTGTSTGATSVAWAASPSGESGACTGTTSWSCAVAVSPDATGEGVETITITATGDGGTGDDTEMIGFYVAGSHSCWLSQSIDGDYNSTLTDADPVATWENLGSSGLDVTQGVGTAQPMYQTSIVGGQPVVFFDGGDRLTAATPSNWTFLHNGTAFTVDTVFSTQLSAPYTVQTSVATVTALLSSSRGFSMSLDDRSGSSRVQQGLFTVASGSDFNIISVGPQNTLTAGWFNSMVGRVISGVGDDGFNYTNNVLVDDVANTDAFSSSDPAAALTIGALGTGTNPLTGFQFAVLIYSSSLSDTQRGINQAVHDWAMGTAMPKLPTLAEPQADVWAFVGDSITSGSSGVTPWPDKLQDYVPTFTFQNSAASGANATDAVINFRAASKYPANTVPSKVFVLVGVNNVSAGGSAASAFNTMSIGYTEILRQGSDLYVMSVMPFGNFSGWSAPDQVQLEALNTSILAFTPVDDSLDLYTLMGEPGTPEDLAAAYDVGDGLHPSEDGTTFMADSWATLLGL